MNENLIFEELVRRREYYDHILTNKTLELNEYELCRRSVIHFCNNWCYTYDPRLEYKHMPFNLWEFQTDTFHWLDSRYNNKEVGVIEKSRDMGVTWLLTVWNLHKFLFVDGFSSLFGSKKEDLVDDKTLDSIFGKIRYNLYKLPHFLRPNMSSRIAGNDSDRYLVLINPENKNEIVGESTNDNFGRGGRKSIVFLDEFAFTDNSEKIWMAVRDTSDCIIAASTPNGKGNQFANLRFSNKVPVLNLHWKKHPHKDDTWYNNRKKDMEDWQIAQELDIDYDASKSGRIYKRFNRQYHVSRDIIYPNPAFEHFITWDFGIADSMTMIFGQIDIDGTIEIYGSYTNNNQDIEFYLPLTLGNRPPNNEWKQIESLEQQRINKLIDKVFHDQDTRERIFLDFSQYGDFAGTQRTANSKRSVRDRMRAEPYNINLLCSRNQSHAWRIQCMNNLLKLRQTKSGDLVSRFRISPDCQDVIDSFFNYIWDSEDVNNPNIKPKHNEASHYMSSLEFFAINRFPVIEKKQSTIEKVR